MKLLIDRLQPSQLFLNQSKLEAVVAQVENEGLTSLPPVPVKYVDGQIFLTDGHTRTFIAYISGETKIQVIWETDPHDNHDWDLYHNFLDEVREAGIYHIQDLGDRILSPDQFQDMRSLRLKTIFGR